MDMTLLVPGVLLAVALIALAWALAQWRGARGRLDEIMAANTAEIGRLRAELDQQREGAVKAATMLEATERQVAELNAAFVAERAAHDATRAAKVEAERDAALKAQENDSLRAQMADWEKTKKQYMDAANEALLKTGREAVTQLLENHKREAETTKKQQEEQVRKTNEELTKQMSDVVRAVAAIKGQGEETRATVDTVMRALSSPGGAGHEAEIHLENTLTSFGLEKGTDFFLQQTVDGGNLRPDAVLLLPGDTVWVIDSKSSKAFLALAEAEGTDGEETAYGDLARTMNQHLRDLTRKAYKSEIVASYKATGRGTDIRRAMSIMFVPHDGAIEKIKRADPTFVARAAESEIVVVGPSMLKALIGFARIEIDLGRQAENQEKIVRETQTLLDRVVVVLDSVKTMGTSIRTAAKAYNKLSSSVTGRLRPQFQKLDALGVRPNRHGGLPKLPPGVQLLQETVIDGDAEEVVDVAAIADGTHDDGDD